MVKKTIISGLILSLIALSLWYAEVTDTNYTNNAYYRVVDSMGNNINFTDICYEHDEFALKVFTKSKEDKSCFPVLEITKDKLILGDKPLNNFWNEAVQVVATKDNKNKVTANLQRNGGYITHAIVGGGVSELEIKSSKANLCFSLNEADDTVSVSTYRNQPYWHITTYRGNMLMHSFLVSEKAQITYDIYSKEMNNCKLVSVSDSGKIAILKSTIDSSEHALKLETGELIPLTGLSHATKYVSLDDAYVYTIEKGIVKFFVLSNSNVHRYRVANDSVMLSPETFRWITSTEFVVSGLNTSPWWSYAVVCKYSINTRHHERMVKRYHFFSNYSYRNDRYTWLENVGFVCADYTEQKIYIIS